MMKPNDFFGAQIAAAKLIEEYAIKEPNQIQLEDIAMARGVWVVEDDLQNAEARLVRNKGQGLIRVRADIPEIGRKRFAIAHELGHWERHKNVSQLHLCTDSDIQGYKGSALELEASAFASALLMPTKLFYPRCKDAAPSLDVIKRLADEFTTTLTATAVRFVEESEESCLVIFSKDGQIDWWRKGKRESKTWLEPRQKIHSHSFAWDCFQGQSETGFMKQVPSKVWFPQVSEGAIEVFEHSIKLGRYDTVLTLLWVIENEDE
jgi:Zn-dependent peptidase ImmA (M78 family)